MIKFITPVFFVAMAAGFCQAQSIRTSTYLEQTHVSPKIGTSVGYQFDDIIEVGGFFQKSTVELEAPEGRPLVHENEFFGAYFAYPFIARKVIDVRLKVRSGVSNGENFVITPSFHANYNPLPALSLGAGVGTRSFRPTWMAQISINLNNKKDKRHYLSMNN